LVDGRGLLQPLEALPSRGRACLRIFQPFSGGARPYRTASARHRASEYALRRCTKTAVATDLQGNVIWSISSQTGPMHHLVPSGLMPNGDFVVFLCPPSYPLGLSGSNIMREVDLPGNTVRQLTWAELNAPRSAAGSKIILANHSHDFVLLPIGLPPVANSGENFTDWLAIRAQRLLVMCL
jgi:hypothetical protein